MKWLSRVSFISPGRAVWAFLTFFATSSAESLSSIALLGRDLLILPSRAFKAAIRKALRARDFGSTRMPSLVASYLVLNLRTNLRVSSRWES